MILQLFAFGITKDILGQRQVSIELSEPATVGSLLETLGARHPELQQLASLRVAVNQSYAPPEQPIGPGDEVVLIPPVSGG